MPTISVFIRQHDLPKWQALENKSQWLHDNLPSNLPSNLPEGQTPAQAPPRPVFPPFNIMKKPTGMSQDDWDESLDGQCAARGLMFLETDDDGQVHAIGGDPSVDDNHYYFEIRYGIVQFPKEMVD